MRRPVLMHSAPLSAFQGIQNGSQINVLPCMKARSLRIPLKAYHTIYCAVQEYGDYASEKTAGNITWTFGLRYHIFTSDRPLQLRTLSQNRKSILTVSLGSRQTFPGGWFLVICLEMGRTFISSSLYWQQKWNIPLLSRIQLRKTWG